MLCYVVCFMSGVLCFVLFFFFVRSFLSAYVKRQVGLFVFTNQTFVRAGVLRSCVFPSLACVPVRLCFCVFVVLHCKICDGHADVLAA